MKGKPPVASGGPRFRSIAAAALSILSIAAVAYLALAPLSGKQGSILLQAQEKPAPSTLPNTNPAPSSPKAALRVATWNVRDCAAWDPVAKERIPLHDSVARMIKDARADIIILEEVQSDEAKGGDIALLSVALAREGWAMPYVAVVNAKGEDDLAVFSRYRIEDYRPVLEPGPADKWPRPGIFASIDAGGAVLDVYGFHFKAMGDAASEKTRRAQAEALGRYLVAMYGMGLSSKAIIVAGDFNTANASDLAGESSTLGALRLAEDSDASNDFLDANYFFRRDEPTFVDSRYSSILDHILLSPVLAARVDASKVLVLAPPPRQGKIPTSDHSMVIVEIFPPRGH
ncbi:MAG: endonuclease/exonuclease/phosphatase family protein [Spirochaetales bacterium]|jgi:endonuclease/exonuclease/phosphatase family metal-dependent hydrolase